MPQQKPKMLCATTKTRCSQRSRYFLKKSTILAIFKCMIQCCYLDSPCIRSPEHSSSTWKFVPVEDLHLFPKKRHSESRTVRAGQVTGSSGALPSVPRALLFPTASVSYASTNLDTPGWTLTFRPLLVKQLLG